jgi:hypothetical protein
MPLERYKILPESILHDPEVLAVLSEAARNAIRGVQSSRIQVYSQPKPSGIKITKDAQTETTAKDVQIAGSSNAGTSTAGTSTRPFVEGTAVGTQTNLKILPSRKGRAGGYIDSTDAGVQTAEKSSHEIGTQAGSEDDEVLGNVLFSPIQSSSPKQNRVTQRLIKSLASFVPRKYQGKGEILIPYILKMINYEANQDRAIALLNYILLDEDPNGMIPPPLWARRYLHALFLARVSPTLFPISKRSFFNAEFLSTIGNQPSRSIAETNQSLADSRKRARHTINTPFALGNRTDRTIPSVTIEETF